MVDVVPRRQLGSRIKKILFVEPQSGYSTGFNDTVRVETLGPEYLAGSVAEVAECELADLRVPGTDLVEHGSLLHQVPAGPGVQHQLPLAIDGCPAYAGVGEGHA